MLLLFPPRFGLLPGCLQNGDALAFLADVAGASDAVDQHPGASGCSGGVRSSKRQAVAAAVAGGGAAPPGDDPQVDQRVGGKRSRAGEEQQQAGLWGAGMGAGALQQQQALSAAEWGACLASSGFTPGQQRGMVRGGFAAHACVAGWLAARFGP